MCLSRLNLPEAIVSLFRSEAVHFVVSLVPEYIGEVHGTGCGCSSALHTVEAGRAVIVMPDKYIYKILF